MCRTAIPTSDAPMTGSAIGAGPNGAAHRGAVRGVAVIGQTPGAPSARFALRNAVRLAGEEPDAARLQASGASETRRPARPNTGAPAGVRMSALHGGNAPGAAGIPTSRTVGYARLAVIGNAASTGNDTRGFARRG